MAGDCGCSGASSCNCGSSCPSLGQDTSFDDESRTEL
ncbi:hypothetical protein FGSG_08354 [Fusarium graminearum PH-1]|nr:hypothetical protein FGSG_08354 [Fusarium graminearum PH-1]ESU15003.1 hypothetical protein FGSG_08354 [Fusarium graminearum PH-1]|eukprot:XP_011320428.1 hypothetical protein FGSG_08354 [Fusarium graminearum PH-1]